MRSEGETCISYVCDIPTKKEIYQGVFHYGQSYMLGSLLLRKHLSLPGSISASFFSGTGQNHQVVVVQDHKC